MRNPDPDLATNRLSRFVSLRFPSLTSATAMRKILTESGLFENVEIAGSIKYAFTGMRITDPYFSAVQTGSVDYPISGVAMQKNPYGQSPRPSYMPIERPSWPKEQTQWYLHSMRFTQAWELLGDDEFTPNPSNGYYGTANVAVLDSGIDPECDYSFESAADVNASGSTCFDSSYPISLKPVRPPHAQLRKNLRRLQSYSFKGDTAGNIQAVSADIISDPSADSTNFTYSPGFAANGGEGFPIRRDFWRAGTAPGTVAATGHGTHTAGLISASLDGVGTVGSCPTCSLNYIQLTLENFPTTANVVTSAISLAARNGVQVINMSFSGQIPIVPLNEKTGAESALSLLNTLLASAAENQIVLVASAGNHRNGFDSMGQVNLPANNPNVIAVGGTQFVQDDVTMEESLAFWSEAFAGSRCSSPTSTPQDECGSAYTTDPLKKMLYAPASRILSTMHGTWGASRSSVNSLNLGLAGCSHELYPADTRVKPANYNTGNDALLHYPAFSSRYGMCTGTSMAAPLISGMAGLLRSANPLLSNDATYQAMKTFTYAIPGAPSAAVNVAQPAADQAVRAVLGEFGDDVAQNRLIPLFAAKATTRQDGAPHVDWLYSSKPQVLRAAMAGELYFTGQFAQQAGTRRPVNYDTATNLAPVAGFSFGSTIKGSESRGRASFYLFASQRKPFGSVQAAGAPPLPSLVPLLRLATDSPLVKGACDARKHSYATPGSVIAVTGGNVDTLGYFSAAARPRCEFLNGTAAPPDANLARYGVVAIEGFVFDPTQPQPKGSVALFLRYSAQDKSYALVTENDVARSEYLGYSQIGSAETLLGYVYANDAVDQSGSTVTSDGDDWPANWELAAGLNADRADSDCDGASDSAEYPLAALPLSNPKQNLCAGSNIDHYAVAGNKSGGIAKFRLRNYSVNTVSLSFSVQDPNAGAHNVTPNFGTSFCTSVPGGLGPRDTMVWNCTTSVERGADGNVEISLDFGPCTPGRSYDAKVEIHSVDGYVANNKAVVSVCN